MKMTNDEIGNALDVLISLHETGKLGYAIAKNIHKLSEAGREYLDMRNELFQKYGKATGHGNTMTISSKENPEGFAEYMKEMGDIPNEEEEIDVYTVDEETFYGGHLTSQQMSTLLWMVAQ